MRAQVCDCVRVCVHAWCGMARDTWLRACAHARARASVYVYVCVCMCACVSRVCAWCGACICLGCVVCVCVHMCLRVYGRVPNLLRITVDYREKKWSYYQMGYLKSKYYISIHCLSNRKI